MNRLTPMLLLLALLALTSCSQDFARKQPNAEDLISEYIPTIDTLKRMKANGYPLRDVSITLGRNGALSFRNVPDCWLTDFGNHNGRFDSGSGFWKLEQNYAVWSVTFDIRSFTPDSAYRKGGLLFSHCATITHNKPPHGLAIAIAAGDRGYLKFRRKDSNSTVFKKQPTFGTLRAWQRITHGDSAYFSGFAICGEERVRLA